MSLELATTPPHLEPSLASQVRFSSSGRRVILLVSAAVVVLSMLLSLGSTSHEVVVPLLNKPLPPMCSLKRYTGLDCPGCGLTRSFIALGHGRLKESIDFNPAGPLWFLLIAGQIPWQTWQLTRISRGQREFDLGWWGQGLIYLGMAALIVQWIVRQL